MGRSYPSRVTVAGMASVTPPRLGVQSGRHGRWEDLTRIAEILRVNDLFDTVHHREVRRRKHERHLVLFLDPHAMLTGDGAAQFGTQPQHVAAARHDTPTGIG